MQVLLTGKQRLPGFQGEWRVGRLKDAAEIATGINKPLGFMGRGVLYVTVQDLYHGNSIPQDVLGRIELSPAEIQENALKVGDIVFGKSSVKREGIGYPSLFLGCAEPVTFSGFTYRARARIGVADARFLFYWLRSAGTRQWLIDNSQSSALTNINKSISDSIPTKLPLLEEQVAIGKVLSDMDAEIAALESRLTKARALKQAMAQALLTGRIRLVEPTA
jgi:type I restriction enzyme S subunit